MIKYILISQLVLFVSISSLVVFANENGSQKKQVDAHKHSEGEKHDEEENHGHDENEEHGEDEATHAHGEDEEDEEHEEEASSKVGPEKGVTEASEKKGIKLSPEAIKNFGLKAQKASAGNFSLPKAAIVMTGEEKNIYRLRSGFYKRIDFDLVQKNGDQWTIKSKNLQAGDEVVVEGVGFLRIAEVAAFDKSEAGHSH